MFDVSAEAYSRFMGRYSNPLAQAFSATLSLHAGDRVLDVGCGPGALTAELADAVGAEFVSAVDPSTSFVAAVERRYPAIDVVQGAAEDLPYDDDVFVGAFAQLVVHFMADPVQGLSEMARVTRPGGVVAATVWDHGGETGPLYTFWRAARAVGSNARDESGLPGVREGHLVELMTSAGLSDVEGGSISIDVQHETFDEWWEPFTLGVGPAGDYLASLDAGRRALVRDRCWAELGDGPFTIRATAWTARGTPGA